MSQAILQELARLKAANEALAARVTALEQRPTLEPSAILPSTLNEALRAEIVKRGPGRPRKATPAHDG